MLRFCFTNEFQTKFKVAEVFRSITNKIALALMVLLIISFCAISAVSYFTSEKKVIELVSKKEEQVLKDIKGVTDTFFDEYLGYVKKSSTIADLQSGDEIINFVLSEKRSQTLW